MQKNEPKIIAPHFLNPREVRECAADTLETFCKETKAQEGLMVTVDFKSKEIILVGFGQTLEPLTLLEALVDRLQRGQLQVKMKH